MKNILEQAKIHMFNVVETSEDRLIATFGKFVLFVENKNEVDYYSIFINNSGKEYKVNSTSLEFVFEFVVSSFEDFIMCIQSLIEQSKAHDIIQYENYYNICKLFINECDKSKIDLKFIAYNTYTMEEENYSQVLTMDNGYTFSLSHCEKLIYIHDRHGVLISSSEFENENSLIYCINKFISLMQDIEFSENVIENLENSFSHLSYLNTIN